MPGRPKPTSASDAAVEQRPSSLPSPVLRSHAGHTCAVSIKRQPCASVNSPPTFSLKQFYLVLVTLKFLSVQWALSRRWPNPKPPIPTCSARPIHAPVSSETTATGPPCPHGHLPCDDERCGKRGPAGACPPRGIGPLSAQRHRLQGRHRPSTPTAILEFLHHDPARFPPSHRGLHCETQTALVPRSNPLSGTNRVSIGIAPENCDIKICRRRPHATHRYW